MVPKESSLFEFYIPGEEFEILPLEESDIYKEDWIGLKELDETGRLIRDITTGGHVETDDDYFVEEIVLKYLQ